MRFRKRQEERGTLIKFKFWVWVQLSVDISQFLLSVDPPRATGPSPAFNRSFIILIKEFCSQFSLQKLALREFSNTSLYLTIEGGKFRSENWEEWLTGGCNLSPRTPKSEWELCFLGCLIPRDVCVFGSSNFAPSECYIELETKVREDFTFSEDEDFIFTEKALIPGLVVENSY